MDAEPIPFDEQPAAGPGPSALSAPQRVFLHEPGWNVALKVGSDRMFCYMMAPGQDYYHRLLDGEIYVHHGDERLCLACAERRTLLSFKPKGLRQPILTFEIDLSPVVPDPAVGEFDLLNRDDDHQGGVAN